MKEVINRNEIILEIERLKEELKSLRKVLQVIDRSSLGGRTGTEMRFYQVRPLTAIKLILRERGPQAREALMQELIGGGAIVGKKRANSNIRISIEKTLKNGTLRELNGLIGLPEWPEDMFHG